MVGGGITLYADLGVLSAWFERASAASCPVIYATGPAVELGHPVVAQVCRWEAEGRATRTKKRVGEHEWRFFLHRLSEPDPRCGGCRPLADPAFAASDEGRILDLIVQAAEAGMPCPSYGAMAKAIGLTDRRGQDDYQAARYRFNQLVKLGRIEVRDGRACRVVRVLGSDLETADRAGARMVANLDRVNSR